MILVPATVDPNLGKKKDVALEFSPNHLADELSLMMGEPLKDTSDLDDLGKDSLEPTMARWLRTAAIFNLERSSHTSGTTINSDIKALANMQPGKNFLRSAAQAEKVQQRLKGEAKNTDVTKDDRLSANLRARAGLEEEKQEAITGVGKLPEARIPVFNDFSDKAKRILQLPIEALVPKVPYEPGTYKYSFNARGQNFVTLLRKKSQPPKKIKGKKTRTEERKSCRLPGIDDRLRLAVLADYVHRFVTYLLSQEGYTWEDDDVSASLRFS